MAAGEALRLEGNALYSAGAYQDALEKRAPGAPWRRVLGVLAVARERHRASERASDVRSRGP